jgi:hypothetical protein
VDAGVEDHLQLPSETQPQDLNPVKTNTPFRFAVLAALAAAPFAARALDGVVVANESVPVASLDAAAFKDICTGKTMYWDGGAAVVIVVAGDQANAALEAASGMNPGAFKTHWQRLGFSSRGQPPKKSDATAKAIELVAGSKGAIAILPAGTGAKGVKILQIKQPRPPPIPLPVPPNPTTAPAPRQPFMTKPLVCGKRGPASPSSWTVRNQLAPNRATKQSRRRSPRPHRPWPPPASASQAAVQ